VQPRRPQLPSPNFHCGATRTWLSSIPCLSRPVLRFPLSRPHRGRIRRGRRPPSGG
jgi:hypothetical protein